MEPSSASDNRSNRLSFKKLKELDAYFDEQLKSHIKKKRESRTRFFAGYSIKKILALGFGLLFLLMLPFWVLVRSSLYLYTTYALNGWLALTCGVGVTILLLLIYAVFVNYRIHQSARVHKYVRRGIAILVVAYCGYGLLYFSGVNAKSAELESYYQSLHPILRVTMATTILLDDDLIVTDMQRSPDDYRSMGLPARDQSLHYQQSTGYVHAVDIRTKGRPEWKNWITKNTFALFGMNTIRHTGTADHLHISLPVND